MGHCKVFAQYRFGEEPVLVFDTEKSARFNDARPDRKAGQTGRVGDARAAAKSFAKKFRIEVPCNVVIEEEAEAVVQTKEEKGGK